MGLHMVGILSMLVELELDELSLKFSERDFSGCNRAFIG